MIGINIAIRFTTLIFLSYSLTAQRGETGQEIFSDRFPRNVETISNSKLLISNETEHDIIEIGRASCRERV